MTHVITTHELLPKFKNVLKQTPTVKHLIFIEEQIHNTERAGYKVSDLDPDYTPSVRSRQRLINPASAVRLPLSFVGSLKSQDRF